MICRIAKETDAEAIAALERMTFSDAWSEKSVSEQLRLEYGVNLVMENEQKLLGYLLGVALPPDSELYRICVSEEARRQGVGRLLLSSFAEILRGKGCEGIYLEVRATNRPAILLYEAEGFSQISRRKQYYSRPTEDAAIFLKGLIC